MAVHLVLCLSNRSEWIPLLFLYTMFMFGQTITLKIMYEKPWDVVREFLSKMTAPSKMFWRGISFPNKVGQAVH